MQELPGFPVSPNGKYWGTEPISLEREKELDKHFAKPKKLFKKVNKFHK